MAVQVINGDLTVPAGTPAAAPVSFTVPQLGAWVTAARLRIPDGPNGLAGWRLSLAGSVLIPYLGAGWVVGNDEVFNWLINRYCNQGQLVVQAYNTGAFPHTFHLLIDTEPSEPIPPVATSLETAGPAAAAQAAEAAAIMSPVPDAALAAAELVPAGTAAFDASALPLDQSVPSAAASAFPPLPATLAPGDLTPYAPVNRAELHPGTHLAARPRPPAEGPTAAPRPPERPERPPPHVTAPERPERPERPRHGRGKAVK